MPEPAPEFFATTQWTVVLQAGGSNAAAKREALAQLCRAYWRPIFSYIRRRGYEIEPAKDLTQEFFARLLERDWLAGLTREGSKFRAFLHVAVRRFLAGERERDGALKRGGGALTFSLDGADHLEPESPGDSPERAYDRRWAVTVIDRAIDRLRREAQASGKTEMFDRVSPFLANEPEAGAYGSALNLQGALGIAGDNSSLTVTNGGAVNVQGATVIGYGGPGIDRVAFDGAGTTMNTASLTIGFDGNNAALTLSNGAVATVGGGTAQILIGNSNTVGNAAVLNIGGSATGPAQGGGILAASGGLIGAGAGTGDAIVQFNTNSNSLNPYYFTTNGTALGAANTLSGFVQIVNTNGFNVLEGVNQVLDGAAINGGASNAGMILVNSGVFETTGNLSNTGQIVIGAAGTLTVANYRQINGVLNLLGGTLDPTSVEFDGGQLEGTGTIIGNVDVEGATVAVGGGVPAALNMQGDYRQNGGKLVFDISADGMGGFFESHLVLDPGQNVNIDDTEIDFEFLNGADPMAFNSDGLFNMNNFLLSIDGSGLGNEYDLASLLQGDTFVTNAAGFSISGFDAIYGNLYVNRIVGNASEATSTFCLIAAICGILICLRWSAPVPAAPGPVRSKRTRW